MSKGPNRAEARARARGESAHANRSKRVGPRASRTLRGSLAGVAVAAWLLLACAMWGSPARAEVPYEWLGRRVVGVEVVGEQAGRLDPKQLGVPTGVPLTRGLIRDAILALGSQGRWADIQVDAEPRAGGIALLFHLTPRLVAKRVEIQGNSAIEDRELTRILAVRDGSELERESFPSWASAVREAYQARGYDEATVKVVLRDTDEPGEKVLRLEITEGTPTRIAQIEFQGDPLPRRKGLRRVLGFKTGQLADRTRIDEGVRRTAEALRQGGFYAAELSLVGVERNGHSAHVVIRSDIGPQYQVRFTNTGPLSRSELFEALALHEERIAGEANLRALEQKLVDTYRRYGFPDARVTIVARPQSQWVELDGERWQERYVLLDVSIETGVQREIALLSFPGAQHFTQAFLREQMYSYLEEGLSGSSLRLPVDSDVADRLGFGGGVSQSRREVPKPIVRDPRRLYYEPAYDSAIAHIRELYRSDGFLKAQVGPVDFEPTPDQQGTAAVISVVEGPRTFLFEVRVENNRELSTRELLAAAALSREAPFSYLKLEEARLRMLDAYREQGYYFAKIEADVRMSEDGTRAEVIFLVEEGYVVRVGGVEIRGAERSSLSMIRDRVRLKLGEPYRPSQARATEDALLALDVFTSVSVAPDEPDLPARVKTVVVTVTERKGQWLGWSGGFSTGEGVRGGFEYGYRNLFGSALAASFRGQIGYQFVFLDQQIKDRYESLHTHDRIEYQTNLTLAVPHIPRLRKTRASVDLSALYDIQRDYRMQKESVVGSFVYRPVKSWTFNASEELEESDFNLFEQKLTRLPVNLTTNQLVPEGQNTLTSTQFTTTWDLRDRAFNPSRGVLTSLTSEYARTINPQSQTVTTGTSMDEQQQQVTFQSNMLRFLASFAFYLPLFPKLTFASQWRYGRIVHLSANSQSYPNRRFYLGGTNFRGYQINQMVPQDIQDSGKYNQSNIVSRGGEVFLAGQNELRFPLFGGLYGGLFTDIGNLWANPKALDLRKLVVVVGAGLRFQTPVASLAFDYGIRAIQLAPFKLTGAFQFSFQTF